MTHVARYAIERRLRDGDALFFKNDPCEFMGVVVAGHVYKILYGPEGQELIVDSIEPGESVGETALLDRGRHSFTAIAYGPATVLVLARRHFAALVAEPAMIERAYAVLCTRLRRAVDSLETMCLHRLESRLARHLLNHMPDAPAASPDRFVVTLPPTQSILAAMINASRPKLNAQLQCWHRTGLISRRRNTLRINDIDLFRCKAQLGRGSACLPANVDSA
ncbi:Crp/Fnr family transcriptional regulator [Marilutibacter alkalisoli]|uniref:Crp/Fnr family transcriptional regulator n=1 Tax=Marilutibacter alkalisoli TaxID=2591633 RepID=UPI00142131BE|nr:Crp/Fnr family transcriptional regulator [Lysobacter alkalisoli]